MLISTKELVSMQSVAICLLVIVPWISGDIMPYPPHRNEEWTFESSLKNYAVLAPKVFLPGRPYSLAVNLLTPDARLMKVDASLACTAGRVGFDGFGLTASWAPTASDEASRSILLSMRLERTPTKLDYSAKCTLTVALKDATGRQFSDTGSVSVRAVQSELFIQTDKAIYKPGQLVKFRVASVSSSLKPVNQNVTVLVKDSEGNLVDRYEHRPLTNSTDAMDAVFTGQFQLSDQPNLGDWSLIAEAQSGKETKTFTVDRYVLPKLQLLLTLPDFVHENDKNFTVLAEPRYTYDKIAEGDLTVNVTLRHNCRGFGRYRRYGPCSATLIGRRIGQLSGTNRAEFLFSLDDWRRQLTEQGNKRARWGDISALVAGEFREKFSGVRTLANKTFTIYKKRYRLMIDTGAVPFILPGMTVPIQLKVVRADGKPYLGPLPSGALTLRMSWFQRGMRKSKQLLSVTPDGTKASWSVPARIPNMADFSSVNFEARCPGLSGKVFASLQSFQTRGQSAVRVEAAQLGTGGDLRVAVHRGDGILRQNVFCAVINHEGLLSHWLPLLPFGSSEEVADDSAGSIVLTAAQVAALAPSFTLLGVGFHGNELVAASKNYQPAGAYDGLALTSNVTKAASPQQSVLIRVSAGPESLVFLTGIDHSVNLMKTGQDISPADIEQRAGAPRAPAAGGGGSDVFEARRWSNSRNTEAELQKSGLLALTDFKYVKEQPVMYFMQANMRFAGGAVMDAAPMAKAAASENRARRPKPEKEEVSSDSKKQQELTVRKFFPESFVWTWLKTDANGSASHSVALPDTITSWDVTGFALSANKPLQASRSPLNIVSRRAFFIRPVLPYALVRGEKFLLKVLLFNYGQSELTVTVTLANDSSLYLLGGEGFARNSTVPAGGSSLVVFPVEPIRLPTMRLALQAVGLLSVSDRGGDQIEIGDAVERRVRVEAEGATQRRVATALLNLTTGASATARLAVNFPDGLTWISGKQLVEGSEYARVQVTGTVLGASVSNLERLLRMPYGCGEQNMINFAPAVFVLDCLGPQEAAPDIIAKAVRIMKTGYQRELTYRRTDGSYSAFGNRDSAGSTWLTAFVLSIYAQAASFIPMDPRALAGPSLDFLLSQQRSDGRFVEGGRVIHADMQGAGASGAAGLTAYVCASLVRVIRSCQRVPDMRCSQLAVGPTSRLASALRRGLRFVYDDYRARPADFRPSDLAVAAYAARLAVEADPDAGGSDGVKVASFLWMQLYEASRSDDGGVKRYWPGSSGSGGGSPETTGYALLAALAHNNFQTAAPALRWLSSQQGDLGGFHSTQDTVVGLQAMAQFARSHPGGDGVGSVTVTWPSQSEPLKFGLGPTNRTLLQQREIGRGVAARALAGEVSVSGTGSGVAMVTVAYAYNLRDAPLGWIGAEWTRRGGVGLRLADLAPLGGFAPADGSSVEVSVCATASNGPGMYIVSLSHPSGFAVDAHTPIGGPVARVEPESDELVFYLSELTSEVCLSVRWVREIPVMDLSPQRITAKNYYQPDQKISLFHLHPKLTGLTECQVCPDCPQCRRPTNIEI